MDATLRDRDLPDTPYRMRRRVIPRARHSALVYGREEMEIGFS